MVLAKRVSADETVRPYSDNTRNEIATMRPKILYASCSGCEFVFRKTAMMEVSMVYGVPVVVAVCFPPIRALFRRVRERRHDDIFLTKRLVEPPVAHCRQADYLDCPDDG